MRVLPMTSAHLHDCYEHRTAGFAAERQVVQQKHLTFVCSISTEDLQLSLFL